MFGNKFGNKLRVLIDKIFGERVVKGNADAFVEKREDIGAEEIKLDLSHRLQYGLKTFLSGVRSSMTDTWYSVKSAVTPGFRVSSEDIKRSLKRYNNLDIEEQSTQVELTRESKTDFDDLDLEPLEVDDTDVVTRGKKFSALASENNSLAEALSGRFERENNLWSFKGLWNTSTEFLNKLIGRKSSEESVKTKPSEPVIEALSASTSEFRENGEELEEQAKRKSNAFTGIFSGWFGKSGSIPYEKLEDSLSVRSEFEEVNLTSPLVLEEKTGLVQRMKNMLTTTVDFFMSPFRATGAVDEDNFPRSSSMTFPIVQTPKGVQTPPPSYAEATEVVDENNVNTLSNESFMFGDTRVFQRTGTTLPEYEETIGAMEGRKSLFQRLCDSANGLIEKYIITPIKSLLSERGNESSTEENNPMELATFNTRHNVLHNGDLYTRDNNNPLVAGRGSIQEKPTNWSERCPSKGSSESWGETVNTVKHGNGMFETHL